MSGKQCWMHVEIQRMGEKMGLFMEDLFVLVQKTQPASRWPMQYHARKNHSYFLVLSRDKRVAFELSEDEDVFPPEGWAPHPDAPGYFHNFKEVLTEAQLRARMVA